MRSRMFVAMLALGAQAAVAVGAAAPDSRQSHVGVLISRQEVLLRTDVAGRVIAMRAQLGRHVRRGTTLAVLDSRDLQIKLEKARATLGAAQASAIAAAGDSTDAHRRFAQRRELPEAWSKDDLARAALEVEHVAAAKRTAESSVVSARAELWALQLQLEATRIVAPFDGWIAAIYQNEGAQVLAHDPVLSLVGSETLWVRFALPAPLAIRIRPGQRLRIVSTDSRITLTATLDSMSPKLDAASGMNIAEGPVAVPDSSRKAVHAGDMVWVSVQ